MTGPLSSVLVHLTWQGALVALAAFLALRFVGPSASVARYRIALGAVALLILAPAGTLARRSGWLAGASPGWIAALPEWSRPNVVSESPASAVSIEPRSPEAPAPQTSATGTGGRIGRVWRAALPWLLAAWLVGALLSLARLGGGIARLHGFRRRSAIAPPSVIREVELLAGRMALAHLPEIRVSGDVASPLTFGALRPVVLLPRRFADDLPAGQVQLVLAHELAHIARHDYRVNLAQCLVEALLFFHPAVRWLSRTAREEREHCCDELAASIAGDRHEVAKALLALEELIGVRHSRSLAPAATGGILLRRIERLVTIAPPPRRFHTMLSLCTLVLAMPLIVVATPASARIAATPNPRGTDDFPVVWSGRVGPGQRLQVRNLVGSIRVAAIPGNQATIRARVSREPLPDLVFEPTRDALGVTVCALRAGHGRCDAEGYTWFGTREEMHRATIDLVVELPAGAGITAAGYEGDLVLDGVSGDAEARTGSGTITARVATGRDDRTLELHTGAGEVRVALPPGFGGTLETRLSNGGVEHQMPLAPIGQVSPQRRRYSLGPGGNRLHTSSGNGSLLLTRSP